MCYECVIFVLLLCYFASHQHMHTLINRDPVICVLPDPICRLMLLLHAGKLAAYHANNEYAYLSDFKKGFKILATLIQKYDSA